MSDLTTMMGKTVNVYTITETLNDQGDVSRARASTTSAVCEIQEMSGDEREVRSGVLKQKDAIGFFKPSDSVKEGDEVDYNSNTYLVVGRFRETIGTINVMDEIHLKLLVE